MQIPTFEHIKKARQIIAPYIHQTPVLHSKSINRLAESRLFFKCENFQKVGAFKFRGATHAVFSLPEKQAARGVATHSSGNHAAALALAARKRGIAAHIVMPETAPQIKKKAVEGYGANIRFCPPTLQARESTLDEVVQETGASFIHPYNNFDVVCGQGTAALELLTEFPDLEIVVAPVGGGGLMSGTAIAAKALKPGIKVFGAEPKNADDAYRSFKSGKLLPSENPKTVCDGLLTSLSPLTFKILTTYADDIFTVSEKNILRAMRMVWERMKIIIEPSSAVPLAAVLENPVFFKNKKTGLIVSGGNVDLNGFALFQ